MVFILVSFGGVCRGRGERFGLFREGGELEILGRESGDRGSVILEMERGDIEVGREWRDRF